MDQDASSRGFRVGFLLIDGFALLSYAAASEPLRAANLLAPRRLYEVRHLAAAGGAATSSSGASVAASAEIGRDHDFDLVLVVAGGDPAGFADPAVFGWLRQLARAGVRLGGVSGGPVILARAGVMAGRRMTVHWEHAPVLTALAPEPMVERSLYVRDRDWLTCAGGIAPLDMMHALIAEQHGPEFARRVSDWFLHTQIRPSGGPQRAGIVERHGLTDAAVVAAIEAMEDFVADPRSLTELAARAGVGPRQLNRLFRDKLGISTMEFYRRLRLDKAEALLRQSALPVTEIALATGFGSSSHFAAAFRDAFGRTPSEARAGQGLDRQKTVIRQARDVSVTPQTMSKRHE